jgi:hypothetical protein
MGDPALLYPSVELADVELGELLMVDPDRHSGLAVEGRQVQGWSSPRSPGHVLPALTAEQERQLATTPVDELMSLPML